MGSKSESENIVPCTLDQFFLLIKKQVGHKKCFLKFVSFMKFIPTIQTQIDAFHFHYV